MPQLPPMRSRPLDLVRWLSRSLAARIPRKLPGDRLGEWARRGGVLARPAADWLRADRRRWGPAVLAALAVAVVVAGAFVTALRPEKAPAAPTGLAGWPAQAGAVRLEWDEVPGATGYQVRTRTGADWVALPHGGVRVRVEGSEAHVSGLAARGPYRFSVRSVNSVAVSEWSAVLVVPAGAPADGPGAGASESAASASGPIRAGRERAEPAATAAVASLGSDPAAVPPESRQTCANAVDLGAGAAARDPLQLELSLPPGARQSLAYRFDLDDPRWVEIALSGPGVDADLYLYNEPGRRLAASQNPGSVTDLVARLLHPGRYCLHVVATEPGGGLLQLSYRAVIPSGQQAAESEWRQASPDLGDMTAIGDPAYATGKLAGGAGSSEYFRFEITRPRQVAVGLSQSGAGLSITLEDSTGGIIATQSPGAADRASVSATLLEGAYYVRVQAGQAPPGDYQLSLSVEAASLPAVAALRAESASRKAGGFAQIESLRLPDLVSDPPTQGGEVGVVVTPEGAILLALRFEGYVTNLGAGPLHLSGDPQLADPDDPSSHQVWQRVRTGSGDLIKFAKPPVRFETSDGHNHFHLMEIVAYSLWDSTGTYLIRPGEKVGFCLLDAEELTDRHPQPGEQGFSEMGIADCMANRPGATTLLMGVTEGWRDIYENDVVFQWVDVSDVLPGRYRIGVEADPYDIVAEADEANNGVALSNRLSLVPGYLARPQVVEADPGEPVAVELGSARFGRPGQPAYRIVDGPANGSLQTAGNFAWYDSAGVAHAAFYSNRVVYTPDPGFAGVDSFTFAAFDSWIPQYPRIPAVATVTVDASGIGASVAMGDAPASLAAGSSIGFEATVTGAGPDLVWTASTIAGAPELAGSISADGYYTAPVRPPPGGTVTIRAASAQAPSAFAETKLTIAAADNTAPAVTVPAAMVFGLGDPVDVAIAAVDVQGDALTWSAEGLPAGLHIVADTGRIVGNPTRSGDTISYVTVSDSRLTTTVPIKWTIA